MSKYMWLSLAVLAAAAVLYLGRPQGTLEEQVKLQAAQDAESITDQPQQNADPAEESDTQPQETDFMLEVPDFEVETTSGKTVKLSELAQDKPTIVGFWASWCHNCQRNLPAQQALYEKYQDQINIIEVNLNEKRSVVDRYVDNFNFTFDLAYDEQGTVGRQWSIRYTNTRFMIDSNGKLIDGFAGDLTDQKIQDLLQAQNA